MFLSFVFKKAKQTDKSSGHAPAPPFGYCDLRNKGVDVPVFGQVSFCGGLKVGWCMVEEGGDIPLRVCGKGAPRRCLSSERATTKKHRG